MKSLRTTALRTLIISSFPLFANADVTYPLGPYPFGLDYGRVYQKVVVKGDITCLSPVGPYFCNTVKNILDDTASPAMGLVDDLPEGDLRLFTIMAERMRARYRSNAQDLLSVSGGFRYQASPCFGALVMFDLDRAKAVDPRYEGKKWRGLAGDLQTAAIFFKKNNLTLTLGRQRVFWGPRPVNLILSETAEPLDLVSAAYRKGKLQFAFLFARLDESRPDSTDILRLSQSSFRDNRYLVGHRLDITFSRRFRLGLFETSLFGGEGRPPELYYLNPLQFFQTTQLNEQEDDNIILGLDFTFLPGRRLSLYGQLLVDDFQIDRRVQGDQEPDEIGYMLGLFRAGETGTFSPDLNLEYVRITNRTYHQSQPRNRYLFRDKLLGHPLGPDADSLSLSVTFYPTARQRLEMEVARCRHGEGSIYQPWDQPWMTAVGDYSEPFPTGVVEKSFSIAARAEGYLPFTRYTADHLFLTLSGGWGSFKNRSNVNGHDTGETWLNLSVSWLGFLEVGLQE